MVVENPWVGLRQLTAARIALGRCGHSVPTHELLAFQLAHARARDAVHHALDVASLANDPALVLSRPALVLSSAAPDRATYLRRPDLGRRLDQASADRLAPGDWDAAIVVTDGLSAFMVSSWRILSGGTSVLLQGRTKECTRSWVSPAT